MDQEEIEREIKSIREMIRKCFEYARSVQDQVDSIADLQKVNFRLNKSGNEVFNEQAAQLDRLTHGLALMNEVVQRQHETNLALCRMLEAKGIDTSHLKVV